MTQRPLIDLKARRFTANMPREDYDRLTALAMRNTIARGTLAWAILHDWLDDNQSLLDAYYQGLSREQGKPIWEIEHEILGTYKRLARSGARDTSEKERVELSLSIPSWDNRRLIGHASRLDNISKSEMWRRAVLPWLRSQDDVIARFWQSASEWLGKDLIETEALLIKDFDEQRR